MVIQTERLYLRELTPGDLASLKALIQNETVMESYGGVRDDKECEEWLSRQQARYASLGYGLWALHLKENDRFIGQCGLVPHEWKGKTVLDLVYILDVGFWNQGYGTEAAKACRDFAFDTLGQSEVYSIIRDINEYSQIISVRLGMEVVDRKTDLYRGVKKPHYLYCARRDHAQKRIETRS